MKNTTKLILAIYIYNLHSLNFMSIISALSDCYEAFIMHVYVDQLYFCKGTVFK